MSSKTIGRFLQGVSEVAVPAALNAQAAEIQRMRDARLNDYAMARQKDDQAFRSGLQEDQQRHAMEMAAPERDLAERVQSLASEYINTDDPAKREKIARDILAVRGQPETAAQRARTSGATAKQKDLAGLVAMGIPEERALEIAYNLGPDVSDAVSWVKMMMDAQESSMVLPGDEGYRSPEQYLKDFETYSRKFGALGGDDRAGGGGGGGVDPMSFTTVKGVQAAFEAGDIDEQTAYQAWKRLQGRDAGGGEKSSAPEPESGAQTSPGDKAEGTNDPSRGGAGRDQSQAEPEKKDPVYEPERAVSRRDVRGREATGPIARWLEQPREGADTRRGAGRGGIVNGRRGPKIHRPATIAEVRTLPQGAVYVDPEDGVTRIKT